MGTSFNSTGEIYPRTTTARNASAFRELRKKKKMFDAMRQKYSNWVSYRRAVDELSRLSQRELADLGISRSDIKFVARRQNG
jgi:uncharacterized protein YjiS (DUF1127 family)